MSCSPEPSDLQSLKERISNCRICIDHPTGKPLAHEPRPVVVISQSARIGIAGQAPGTRVHQSGRPFTDPSGDRLRQWMGIDETLFYDADKIAIVPMGFCFPGLNDKGADLPPRKECAAHWRNQVMEFLDAVDLWLIIGLHAQKWHLGKQCGRTLTETVGNWKEISKPEEGVRRFPLPHPSWRNNRWLAQHPWFGNELLPRLKEEIAMRA